MDSTAAAPRWHFNDCQLDEASLQLQVAGSVIEIERKPLEVLRFLLRHAGEVVTKDEILEAVWPGRFLSDSALAKAVSRLREVLGPRGAEAIRTVHGYGYRLVAEVRVEQASTGAAAPVLGLRAGDSPPLRPGWRLLAHIGSGGRGEVWRVETGSPGGDRVLKFALDAAALGGLRREITLSRLLQAGLGAAAPVVPVLDWNLQQAPFFIELPWLPLGSLSDWAAARGGLAAIPLETRLVLAAEIAEALGAAHGLGVLHKDLKPGNVLLDGALEAPRVRLADFGSGLVLAGERLEAYGITRMGFTVADATAGSSSGTPMYLAPELLAGQPPSAASDVYAMGVLLYQFVIGDLRRPLSPGWEREIDDPLLREDIAAAADGNPVHRQADARELARRLRQLDARRAERARQAEAAQRLQQAAADAEELRRLRQRRRALWAVAASLALGLGVSLWQYRAAVHERREAEQAQQRAERVSNFLGHDLFSPVVDERNHVPSLTVQSLLAQAAARIPRKLADDPGVAAQLHATLGNALADLQDFRAAFAETQRAADLASSILESDPRAATAAIATIGTGSSSRPMGDYPWERALQLAAQVHGAGSAEEVGVLAGLSVVEQRMGALRQSQERLQAYRDRHPRLPPERQYWLDSLLADALGRQGLFLEAAPVLARALDPAALAAAGRPESGFQRATQVLGEAYLGHADRVRRLAPAAEAAMLRHVQPGHPDHLFVQAFNGLAYAEIGDRPAALKATATALDGLAGNPDLLQDNGYFLEIFRARVLALAGQPSDAAALFAQAYGHVPDWVPKTEAWRFLALCWGALTALEAGDTDEARVRFAEAQRQRAAVLAQLTPHSEAEGAFAELAARFATRDGESERARREWKTVAESRARCRGQEHPLTLAARAIASAAAPLP